jgi:hypothetical protein
VNRQLSGVGPPTPATPSSGAETTSLSGNSRVKTARSSARSTSEEVRLALRSLRAGYGEHLFNEIARDVIRADIAVFETSDRNPNVMIEMGVALTTR